MATNAAEIEFIPDAIDFVPDAAAGANAAVIEFIPDDVAEEGQKATMGALQAVDVMAAPGRLDWSDVNERLDQERFYEAESLRAQAAIDPRRAPELLTQSNQAREGITPFTSTGRRLLSSRVAANEGLRETMDTQARQMSIVGIDRAIGPSLSANVGPILDAAAQSAGPAVGGALGAASFVNPGIGIARLLLPLVGGYVGAQMGGSAQEMTLRATESDEQTTQRIERQVQARIDNPGSSILGSMAAGLPFFRPSPAQIGRAMGGSRPAIINIAAAGGIGAGTEVASALSEGRPIEARDVLAAGFANMLMSEPTRLGRRMGFPATPAEVARVAVNGPREITPIELGQGIANRGTTSTADVFANVPRGTPVNPPETPAEAPKAPISTLHKTLISAVSNNRLAGNRIKLIDGSLETLNPIGGIDQDGVMTLNGFVDPSLVTELQDASGRVLWSKQPVASAGVATDPAGAPEVTNAVSEAPAPAPEIIAGVEFVPDAPVNPERVTGIRNAQTEVERAERGISPAEEVATRTFDTVWKEVRTEVALNPSAPDVLISELREKPRALTDREDALLLSRQIDLQNAYDKAAQEVNSAFDSGDQAQVQEATAKLNGARDALSVLYDIDKKSGSETGRGLAARKMMARQDYTLAKMETELRASQGGEPLSESQLSDVRKQFETISNTQNELDARIASLESQKSATGVDEVIAKNEASIDPVVKSLSDRIIAKLEVTAANSSKELSRLLREQMKNTSVNPLPNPLILVHVAKIAAAKAAKGVVKFAQWSADMVSQFGENIRPYLQAGWDQREQHIDSMVDSIGGSKKKEVGARVKKTAGSVDQMARIDTAIGNRIKEGKPLSELGTYVKKLAEQFVKSGINQRDPLIDAVHQSLQAKDPKITREQARDLISGYGESTALSKDQHKIVLRDLKGQMQQVAKLEALAAKEPLKKTGPQRRVPSAEERKLIKQVNDAKKKFGVVVTNPETQLKSTLDSVRSRLRNELEDLSLEIETGEKPPTKTSIEYTQDIEILKGVRDRVRETLRSLDGPQKITDKQRVATSKRSVEASISALERRLAGDKPSATKNVSTPEIETLRAKRDALRAQLDELNAMDAVLAEEKKAQGLVRSIEAAENQLANNASKARIQGADSQLVSEARAQLGALREQIRNRRESDPQRRIEQIEKAERALEDGIRKLDADLQTGRIDPNTKPTELQSERLDYLRAQKAAMSKLRDELRAEARPKLTREEVAIKARKTFLANQTADLLDRTARGDFAKRERPVLDLSKDPDAVRLSAENAKAKEQFASAKLAAERAARSKARKAWDAGKDTVDATTNFLTSLDLSALRQGMIAAISRPSTGLKNIGSMLKAFSSERRAREINQAIELRPNAQNGKYQRAGLAVTPLEGGSFTAREENMGARLAELIPGVRMSNRAFVTFLNKMRADTFDALVDMAPNANREQLQALGSFVNVATGRGDFGKFSGAIPLLGRVLWSPRLLLSRIQYLTGTPFIKGDATTRKIIGKEYLRFMTGLTAIYTLASLGKWATNDEMDVGTDPRSSDFGKIIVGNTRIDPLGGLAQVATLVGRLSAGETKSTSGKVRSTTDDKARYGTDAGDVLGKFFRSKLNPVAGTSWDIISRRLYDTKPTTIKDVAVNALVPLSLRDIPDNVRQEGIAKTLGLWVLNTFGISARSYEPK